MNLDHCLCCCSVEPRPQKKTKAEKHHWRTTIQSKFPAGGTLDNRESSHADAVQGWFRCWQYGGQGSSAAAKRHGMSSLRFTVLVGGDCPCHLIELEGGISLLVDCGWDESFSVEQLAPIIR